MFLTCQALEKLQGAHWRFIITKNVVCFSSHLKAKGSFLWYPGAYRALPCMWTDFLLPVIGSLFHVVYHVPWPSFRQITKEHCLMFWQRSILINSWQSLPLRPWSGNTIILTLIAWKHSNAAKPEVFFSFSAFEESGMLESDEVFWIYHKVGIYSCLEVFWT